MQSSIGFRHTYCYYLGNKRKEIYFGLVGPKCFGLDKYVLDMDQEARFSTKMLFWIRIWPVPKG